MFLLDLCGKIIEHLNNLDGTSRVGGNIVSWLQLLWAVSAMGTEALGLNPNCEGLHNQTRDEWLFLYDGDIRCRFLHSLLSSITDLIEQ